MARWKIDADHSSIMFSAKYLLLNTINGYFADFKAEVRTEGEDITDHPLIDFTAEINSVQTNQPQRDEHLLSADFFDAEQYSQISFKSIAMEQVNIIKNPFPIGPYQKSYHLEGNLTIKGITRPVTFKVEHQGKVTDQYDRSLSVFTLKGLLSRRDFGITWGKKTPAGKAILSDEIRISCSLQFVQMPEAVLS